MVDPSVRYGVIDFRHMSTEPGGIGPLAPPAGWSGSTDDYVSFLRRRYRDTGGRQHLIVAARTCREQGSSVIADGANKAAALRVLRKLDEAIRLG